MLDITKNTGELLIVFVGIIIIGVDGADDDNKWSLVEPGIRCGRVPMMYEQRSESSARNGAQYRHPGEGRILHGRDAKFGEWPWIVHLKANIGNSEGPLECSGTLINSQWILSAGHCGVIGRPDKWRATLGLYDIHMPDSSATEVLINDIIVHPSYKDLNNDVALFRLSTPVEYNKYIQPVCLISSEVDLVSYTNDKTCVAIGYGRMVGDEMPRKLQELPIAVREIRECVPYLGVNGRFKKGAACTGPVSEVGATCRGDSGGPNVCFNKEEDRWELFGSVSYGPKVCDREQGDKWLTAVADLTKYVDWIRETVRGRGGGGGEGGGKDEEPDSILVEGNTEAGQVDDDRI